jgi:GalNAc-alpha-(1->4)-GalNAc-alpha-(1->3)-diNAcBac-PP-undecaprenol alpha-1,4-N-acetyl-D-galactosaminyltransferase
MKIHLIISSLKGGGAERVLLLLASGFVDINKYEVSVITLNKGDEYGVDHKDIKQISLSHGVIPNHSIRSFINLFRFYKKKENRPDIIISFITLTNLITIPVAKWYSIKIIAAEHINHLHIPGPSFLSNFTKKWLYRKADMVTVLTAFDIAYYKKHGANVMVMPNPCTFKPIENTELERENVILAVGNLDRYHHKGLDNLIPMVAPILKSNPQWKLKIAGNGDDGLKFLSAIVKEYNMDNQIIFSGFVSNMSELMQKSSIFILPSRFEGLPMAVLEAMSQGMACIAYDCKTGPSDIINKKNGVLIEDQNKVKMSKELLKLMHSESLRKSLSENGVKSLERYNIVTIMNDYKTLFERIIDNKQ